MKKIFSFLFLAAWTCLLFGQSKQIEKVKNAVAEGKMLYKLEMASWYGTDVFLEKYHDIQHAGGYFSYLNGDSATCVFFSKGDTPIIIARIIFDSTYRIQVAKYDSTKRTMFPFESQLYILRKNALDEINSNRDFFPRYRNTQFNLVPIVSSDVNEVYVLTAPQIDSLIIFGNDFLLTFDEDDNLIGEKNLHANIIIEDYRTLGPKFKEVTGSYHTHLPSTGQFFTATDICTLMLYEGLRIGKVIILFLADL